MLINVLLRLRDSPGSIPSTDLRGTEFFVLIKKSICNVDSVLLENTLSASSLQGKRTKSETNDISEAVKI